MATNLTCECGNTTTGKCPEPGCDEPLCEACKVRDKMCADCAMDEDVDDEDDDDEDDDEDEDDDLDDDEDDDLDDDGDEH